MSKMMKMSKMGQATHFTSRDKMSKMGHGFKGLHAVRRPQLRPHGSIRLHTRPMVANAKWHCSGVPCSQFRSAASPPAPLPRVRALWGGALTPPHARVTHSDTPPLPPSMPFEYPGIRPPALAGDSLWSERFLTPSRCWPRHCPLSRWPIDDPCKGEGGWMHYAAVWYSRRRGIRPSHPLGPCAGFSAFHCGLPRQPQHGAHRGSLE